MRQYILQRLLIAIPTVFGVTVLIFLAMRVIPGDPLQTIYTEATGAYILSEEELAEVRASLGLDKPCGNSTCPGWARSSGARWATRSGPRIPSAR